MFYEEPAKKLPVSASVDVLVVGIEQAAHVACESGVLGLREEALGGRAQKPCSLSSSATSAALPPPA